MAFLEWNESFATGIIETDTQHRKLFKMISDLYFYNKNGLHPQKRIIILFCFSYYQTYRSSYNELPVLRYHKF
jgi:hemerythrin